MYLVAKVMYLGAKVKYLGARVMYLGAMWRWGRVGDILADVLSYRSCLTREREGGGLMPHRDTQLEPNQIILTNQTKPNEARKAKPNIPND